MEKHGLDSLDELSFFLNNATPYMESVRSDIIKIKDYMKHLTVVIEYEESYKENLPVFKQYQSTKDKELFLQKDETEITLFESVLNQLEEMGYN